MGKAVKLFCVGLILGFVRPSAIAAGINDNPAFKPGQFSKLPAKNCVAVIDTGIDYNHENFRGAIFTNPKENNQSVKDKIDLDKNGYAGDVHGWDFVDNDPYPFDYI